MTGIIRPPQPGDVEYLAPRLREIDELECRVMSGLPTEEAIYMAIGSSEEVWVGTWDGEPCGIMGVSPGPLYGVPWLLGTDEMAKHPAWVARHTLGFVSRWNRKYPLLYNLVHDHNTLAKRWLRWSGFTFGSRTYVDGEPFIAFKRKLHV